MEETVWQANPDLIAVRPSGRNMKGAGVIKVDVLFFVLLEQYYKNICVNHENVI